MRYIELPVKYYTRDKNESIVFELFNIEQIYRIAPSDSGTTDLFLDRTTIINVAIAYEALKKELKSVGVVLPTP